MIPYRAMNKIMKPAAALCVIVFICVGNTIDKESLRKQLRPFDITLAPKCSTQEIDYFRYYGIAIPHIKHWIGYYRCGSDTIAAQMFVPDTSKATIVFLHGYYDHIGLLAPVIRESLRGKYSFAAIDLPGHGLSSGAAASIDDFTQYRDALRDFLALITLGSTGPLVLAGHSTGCSIIFDYCATQNDADIVKVIFAAPLVRSAYWYLGKLGYRIVRPFSSKSGRWYRISSHDTAFLAFQRKDPLGSSTFPLAWANALYTWERSIKTYGVMPIPTVIIQGDHDATVDWRFNCTFLKKKCCSCSVHVIKNARHHLIHEGEPYRSRFMELFFNAIEHIDEVSGK
jgi:alpha-beta hydrolase superfamily lysophospholipase